MEAPDGFLLEEVSLVCYSMKVIYQRESVIKMRVENKNLVKQTTAIIFSKKI